MRRRRSFVPRTPSARMSGARSWSRHRATEPRPAAGSDTGRVWRRRGAVMRIRRRGNDGRQRLPRRRALAFPVRRRERVQREVRHSPASIRPPRCTREGYLARPHGSPMPLHRRPCGRRVIRRTIRWHVAPIGANLLCEQFTAACGAVDWVDAAIRRRPPDSAVVGVAGCAIQGSRLSAPGDANGASATPAVRVPSVVLAARRASRFITWNTGRPPALSSFDGRRAHRQRIGRVGEPA